MYAIRSYYERRGISGTKATVIIDNADNEKHRHLRHVEEIVNNSTLPETVKSTALKIFGLIAHAEANVITSYSIHYTKLYDD